MKPQKKILHFLKALNGPELKKKKRRKFTLSEGQEHAQMALKVWSKHVPHL